MTCTCILWPPAAADPAAARAATRNPPRIMSGPAIDAARFSEADRCLLTKAQALLPAPLRTLGAHSRLAIAIAVPRLRIPPAPATAPTRCAVWPTVAATVLVAPAPTVEVTVLVTAAVPAGTAEYVPKTQRRAATA